MAEHADGICVSAHHHVGEAYIVVGCEVCGHNAGEHGFLIELNIIKSLQRKTEVSEKAVNSQKTNDREISKHSVERLRSIIASPLP